MYLEPLRHLLEANTKNSLLTTVVNAFDRPPDPPEKIKNLLPQLQRSEFSRAQPLAVSSYEDFFSEKEPTSPEVHFLTVVCFRQDWSK